MGAGTWESGAYPGGRLQPRMDQTNRDFNDRGNTRESTRWGPRTFGYSSSVMPIKLVVTAVAMAVLGTGCSLVRGANTSSTEAHRLVEGGALLVDVRSPEEFKAGHIEGAVNIP